MIEVRTLEPGEKITENGFYNIPLSVHHNQPCDGVSVTSGVLRDMVEKSPADVWAFHKLNPKARAKNVTPAMRQGGAMAALIAGGMDELKRQFLLLKDGAPRRPSDAQWAAFHEKRAKTADTIRACKFWTAVNADPRPAITYAERVMLLEMAEVLRHDPDALAFMTGLPEMTMAFYDESVDLWLLSRPDTVAPDNALTSDYKKIAAAHRSFNQRLVDNRIEDGRFDMQMGFACDVYSRLTGMFPTEVGIVAQSEKYPYHVIATPLSEEDLTIGIYDCERAAKMFRECLDANYWPGPGKDIRAFRRNPHNRERKLEQMREDGFVT